MVDLFFGYAEASQGRIEALRRRLSNQANSVVPEVDVVGAPFTSQSVGAFSAGNPQVPDEIPPTQPDEPQTPWEPPVGRYHPREVEFQSPPEPSPNKNTSHAAAQEAPALPATGLTAQDKTPANELGGNAGLDLEDKVTPEDSVSEAPPNPHGGNPYWKLLG